MTTEGKINFVITVLCLNVISWVVFWVSHANEAHLGVSIFLVLIAVVFMGFVAYSAWDDNWGKNILAKLAQFKKEYSETKKG